VPVGYLLSVAIVGAFTVVALAPPRRPRPVARLSYAMGVVVNEVPHLAAALPLASATVQGFIGGNLSLDGTSLTLLGAAGTVFAGLAVVAARGIHARASVADALRQADIAVPRWGKAWAWHVALTPLPIRPRRVARIANLQYGESRRQRLDVYHRRDRPSGGPVLVYLHGGGYYSGSKHHEGRALLHQLAARGWVCISATYRLRPRAGFEEHLADAHAALTWARANATEYGGDPTSLVLAGSSAGAHLTSLLALDADGGPSAAICLYGHYGRYYGRTADEPVPSTPFALSAAHAPPFFVAHGENDTWTPAAAARQLTKKLRKESPAPVVGVELPGGQHGFDLLRSWRYTAVLAGIDAFLADPRIGIDPKRLYSPLRGAESRSEWPTSGDSGKEMESR